MRELEIEGFDKEASGATAAFSKTFSFRRGNISNSERATAIAQWIRLCLTFCSPGFDSQAHHLRF